MREAEGCVLRDVGDPGAECAAISHRGTDLIAGVADDDPDLDDARLDHVLDAVEQDRFVGHRHELLGTRMGDGPKARARAAREDEPFHGALSSIGVRPAPPGQGRSGQTRRQATCGFPVPAPTLTHDTQTVTGPDPTAIVTSNP